MSVFYGIKISDAEVVLLRIHSDLDFAMDLADAEANGSIENVKRIVAQGRLNNLQDLASESIIAESDETPHFKDLHLINGLDNFWLGDYLNLPFSRLEFQEVADRVDEALQSYSAAGVLSPERVGEAMVVEHQ